MIKLKQYSTEIIQAISNESTEIFEILKQPLHKEIIQIVVSSSKESICDLIAKTIGSLCNKDESFKKWVGFLVNLILFKSKEQLSKETYSIDKIDCIEIYNYLKESYNNYLELFIYFEQQESIGKILKFFFNKFFLYATKADKQLEEDFSKPSNLDDCGKLLMHFFSRFQSSDDKQTLFHCCLSLIKVYFKLKTYRNTKTLIGWVERSELNIEKELPLPSASEYFYYCGRLHLYNMELLKSRECFQTSFSLMKKINKDSNKHDLLNNIHYKNKQLILEYLIILNMFYGQVPSKSFLLKYSLLDNYGCLVSSFISGDVYLFEKASESLDMRMITLGTFLVCEKLKGFVMRNMVMKVYDNMKEEILSANFPVLKLSLIFEICKKNKSFDDFEEFEFYMISVIYKGLIKGYIHNEKKEIVFSKKEPFPKLSFVMESNYDKII
jgi:hypothetical protein